MAEQIVDIIEATMPASSDVVVAARSAGGAAGLEAGRTAASELAGDMRDRLNALSSRLDVVVASGSDGGDVGTELRDVRVGADGTTYGSAGEAVRAQARLCVSVSEASASGVSGVRVILHRGEVLHESGIGYKTVDGVLCYVTDVVMASAGEEYVYTGSANGAPFVFFYDSLMRNVGSVRTDNLNGEYVFQVPDGASYMRAQSFAWTDSTSDVTLSLREKDGEAIRWMLDGRYATALNVGRVSDAVGGVLSDVEGLVYGRGFLLGDETVLSPRYDEMTSGAFLNSSGGATPFDSGYTSDYIDLDLLGDTYITVRTMVAYASRAAALYNRDYEFIRILGDNEDTSKITSVEFTVPLRECRRIGGAYIRFGFLGYIVPDANKFQVVSTAPVALGDYIDSRNVASYASNVLYGKKYVACGDSFTAGAGLTGDDYDHDLGTVKSYPWWIAKRNGMTLVNEAISGSDFTNIEGANNPFSVERYLAVPNDVDYITLMFGLNEYNLTAEQIGSRQDTGNTTLWGAYNTVFERFLTDMPYAKIGVIIPDAWMTETYADAIKDICRYWGVPWLDLKGDPSVPMGIGGRNGIDVSPRAVELRNKAFRLSDADAHPNAKAHEYRSTIIEHFLRTL